MLSISKLIMLVTEYNNRTKRQVISTFSITFCDWGKQMFFNIEIICGWIQIYVLHENIFISINSLHVFRSVIDWGLRRQNNCHVIQFLQKLSLIFVCKLKYFAQPQAWATVKCQLMKGKGWKYAIRSIEYCILITYL